MNNKSFKELFENPLIKDITPDAISKWDLSKEEFYNWTFQDIEEKMGWKGVDTGLERLIELSGRGKYYFSLYSKEECAKDPEKATRNFVFMPSDDASANDKPFILLVPGGGFGHGFANGAGMCMEGWTKRAIEWFEGK